MTAMLEERPPTRPARSQRETTEVVDAARRMIRAVGRRASEDVDALKLLADLGREVEDALAAAARACHEPKLTSTCTWSWTEIGRVLGMSKQAAQQRFGTVDGDQ